MKKDLNQIAKIEKAMSKKFGKESIVNPKSGWDDEKEKEYLEDLKEFYSESSSSVANFVQSLETADSSIEFEVSAATVLFPPNFESSS